MEEGRREREPWRERFRRRHVVWAVAEAAMARTGTAGPCVSGEDIFLNEKHEEDGAMGTQKR